MRAGGYRRGKEKWDEWTGLGCALQIRVVCGRHPSQEMDRWAIITAPGDRYGRVVQVDTHSQRHAQARKDGSYGGWVGHDQPVLPLVEKFSTQCPEPACRPTRLSVKPADRDAVLRAVASPGRHERWHISSDVAFVFLSNPEAAVQALSDEDARRRIVAGGGVCQRVS